MTSDELAELGVSTDLMTAARAIGISKSAAYNAARNGSFPCRVIRVGGRYIVPTAELRQLLGVVAA